MPKPTSIASELTRVAVRVTRGRFAVNAIGPRARERDAIFIAASRHEAGKRSSGTVIRKPRRLFREADHLDLDVREIVMCDERCADEADWDELLNANGSARIFAEHEVRREMRLENTHRVVDRWALRRVQNAGARRMLKDRLSEMGNAADVLDREVASLR
jgi:hypothetical protein